ncbi:hypothetical protein, partial [Herminiimonas sp.]|uniref:hypothetical protein n=1 Tax=Herminiimonas sp. TaxID=1926289 RepID=UPI00272AE8BC
LPIMMGKASSKPHSVSGEAQRMPASVSSADPRSWCCPSENILRLALYRKKDMAARELPLLKCAFRPLPAQGSRHVSCSIELKASGT